MSIRRKILGIATAGAVAMSSAACTTTQITSFIGQVQADAAVACAFVPTVDTILAIAASLGFAPAAAAAGAIQAVTAVICSKIPPSASARYQAIMPRRAGGPASSVGPVIVVPGQPPITINGWRTH